MTVCRQSFIKFHPPSFGPPCFIFGVSGLNSPAQHRRHTLATLPTTFEATIVLILTAFSGLPIIDPCWGTLQLTIILSTPPHSPLHLASTPAP
ncbi:hypothetical protein BC826DRAFT_1104493 [Russula brevipes]|nr:hypothetical protein BC826DRAFT_1104493 [Russula brevipes]